MDNIMADEINRVSPEKVLSEFELKIADEIFAWSMLQDKMFATTKDLINAFWKEKLN